MVNLDKQYFFKISRKCLEKAELTDFEVSFIIVFVTEIHIFNFA